MADNRRTGGQILVDQLRLHGTELCFGVPGESYLAVLDALHDVPELRYVICRQEGGVAMMAEAYGKLTGRPGIAFVTRGPGATNASAGVHIAHQDSTPMILFVGQIDRGTTERESFQELDYRKVFASMTKWAAQIDDPARIPEFVHRAFMTATAGRPGPVVLALPEDMLAERSEVGDARPYHPLELSPGGAELQRLAAMLAKAERPIVMLGGSGWSAAASAALTRFLDAWRIPVTNGFRRQDIVDNEHTCYVGDLGIGPNPDLVARVRAADLMVVLGSRLGEMSTQGFTLLEVPRPVQRLVHVHPDPEELGRVYQADLAICSSMRPIAEALAQLAAPAERPWAADTARLRESYLAWRRPRPMPGGVTLGAVIEHLKEVLPPDAIVTNGAGNYAVWPNRFYPYRGFRTQLSPCSGSMGYGLPAAVAAKLVHPERTVVCFAGDGCFQMTGQELGTAVQYGCKGLVVLVVNNGMYGTIRMHQEREYPTRVFGTDLKNPDFALLARAYGAFGATVRTQAEFAPALTAALAHDGPALIEIQVDPEALTPRATLAEIRSQALAAGR